MLEHGAQVIECDFHKARDVFLKRRIAMFLEVQINKTFKDTYLQHIKQEIILAIREIK